MRRPLAVVDRRLLSECIAEQAAPNWCAQLLSPVCGAINLNCWSDFCVEAFPLDFCSYRAMRATAVSGGPAGPGELTKNLRFS